MPKKKVLTRRDLLPLIKERLSVAFNTTQTKTYPKTKAFILKRPMFSFILALGLLFLLIVLNSVLTPKPKIASEANQIKDVALYNIGSGSMSNFSAKVDKKGVIQIVAQAPGIISNIDVFEGQEVWRGASLVSLSNNYVGGNALSVARQIAYAQYRNIKDTYGTQKDLISKQRDIANNTDDNADQLRNIADKSLQETNNIISLNNDVILGLQTALDTAKANGDTAAVSTITPLLIQAKSANLQLNSASRSAQFASDPNNPPAKLSDLGREIAIKQLDLQQKALDLSREVSKLSLALAQISESAMYPSSPVEGVVEKIHVSIGQSVNPGQVLVTISGTNKNAVAVALVPFNTAAKISKLDESILHISGKTFKVIPDYVSSEATHGQLSSVTYTVPDEAYGKITDGGYIKVEIPIGHANSIAAIPYLPIDIIFQTQDGAFIYVYDSGKVKGKKVVLGDVVGSNVVVESGLSNHDQVILDRNVIEGESVRPIN